MYFEVQRKTKSETPACGLYNKGIRLCSAVGHCVVPNATCARPNHRLRPALCCSYHTIPPFHSSLRHRLPFPGAIQLFIPLGSLCFSIPVIFLKYANFSFFTLPIIFSSAPIFYVIIAYSISSNIFHSCYITALLRGKSNAPTLYPLPSLN